MLDTERQRPIGIFAGCPEVDHSLGRSCFVEHELPL